MKDMNPIFKQVMDVFAPPPKSKKIAVKYQPDLHPEDGDLRGWRVPSQKARENTQRIIDQAF